MNNVAGKPVLVLAGAVYWDGPWFAQQHLSEALSRHFRVLLVEVPVSVTSPLRDRARLTQLRHRRRVESGSLAVMTPVGIPPQDEPRMRTLNGVLFSRQIRAMLLRLGWPQPAHLLLAYQYSWRLVDRFPTASVCALLFDDPPDRPLLEDPEWSEVVHRSGRGAAVSPPLFDAIVSTGRPGLLLPQGVDAQGIRTAATLGEPDDLASIGHPRIGYIGTLTSRIDAPMIIEVATQRPDWQFVFVGARRHVWHDVGDLDFEDLPNVHMLGARPRSELGRYLAGFDAAWVPYDWSPFNRSSNPLKVMEYLAGGLPVAANRFPALEQLGDLVELFDEGEPVVDVLERALAKSADPAAREERLAYAAANDWAARAATLADFLGAR